MKQFFSGAMLLAGILFLIPSRGKAQKKLIDDTSYKNWSWLNHDYQLSGDGRFVSFDIDSHNPAGRYGLLLTTKGEELMRTTHRRLKRFSDDSRYLVSALHSDSIQVFDLAKRKTKTSIRGSEFQLLTQGKNNWLVCQMEDSAIVLNIETGYSTSYKDVKQILPVAGNTAVVLRQVSSLVWLDLGSLKDRTIFGEECSHLVANKDGSSIAFMHTEKDQRKIYHFNPFMSVASVVVSNDLPELNGRLVADNQALSFTPDGKGLFFQVQKKYFPPAKDADLLTNEVEVWHYRDPVLFASRKYFNPAAKSYKAVVSLEAPGARPVLLEDDSLVIFSEVGNNYAIVKKSFGRDEEGYFNESQLATWQLVSLKDGSGKPFISDASQLWFPFLSPAEKFIIWSNKDDEDFYTYEIATGITRNITLRTGIVPDIPLINYGSPLVKFKYFPHSWLAKDEQLLVADKYDCWLLDPLGVKAPVNITNGYGRRNKIVFEPALSSFQESLQNGRIMLRARNARTCDNGFWEVKLPGGDPVEKIMEPAMYSWHKINEPQRLRKAKNAEMYIVTRQTAASSMNLLVSSDLKHFRQLSHIQPEQDYNWMRSELLLFRKKDGDTGKAILYKPDNFDPARKYPVIFHYYQTRNEELHDYRRPAPEPNQIDIPWYVSNGYLVCIPDINHYKAGRIAETVINSVEGAARYLCRFPWVDSTKLGAQGHSFGGYETLLLISHSRMFAAAQASAAVSDLVSAIGGMAFGDHELYTWHETGQANMGIGNLPWSNTQSYIHNSPVFHADKITTPLLLMHGYLDENVKIGQDIEMFTALRRLQKPVWILAYKDGHIISDWDEKGRDAILRQRQFFEHYLRGKPAPVWMTKGILPEERNFKSGLQADTTGAKP
jgi:dienelactone hydrolase